MRRSARPLMVFLIALLAPWAVASPALPKPKEVLHYGVYMANARVGAMVASTYDVTANGKPAVRMDADTNIQSPVLGTNVEQRVFISELVDRAGHPLTTHVLISSLGRSTDILARYEPTRVVCDVDAGGQKGQKVVPIPKGIVLSGDPDASAGVKAEVLKVGEKKTEHFFEPITMTIQTTTVQVLKEGTRTVGGKPRRAYLLKTSNSFSGDSQTWVDDKGQMLEDNSSAGIRLVREDLLAEGPGLDYTPPQDFAVATALRTAVKVPDPRHTHELRLKVSGIPDESLVLSDARQQVLSREKQGETLTVTYKIDSRPLPPAGLPAAAPTAEGPGLGDAIYLGIHDPVIAKQAAELKGGETDRTLIARRVRAWVRGHMDKINNVGAPRSAAEIFRSRDGVCRDYATLFAAVVRAAGVPTRVCSGIVYFRDAFYYHAWDECQLADGPDGWFAFDSTLDDDFVDATHVKFAQGDPAEMFAAVRVVGQIKAEVLGFE